MSKSRLLKQSILISASERSTCIPGLLPLTLVNLSIMRLIGSTASPFDIAESPFVDTASAKLSPPSTMLVYCRFYLKRKPTVNQTGEN
mmetsp:Transcript_4678/g.6077  ORF Transcript_4678/g.6077 Transcript_4678/m.6077 type:complete len:88 (-) Transcript_4678:115-378(-)